MRLEPITDLKCLERGVEALCERVPGWTPEWVFEEIGLRHVEPYAVLSGNQRVAITLLREERLGTGRVLNIWGLWGEPDAPRGWVGEFFDLCRALARERGLSEVLGSSPRRGWKRFTEALRGEEIGTLYRLQGV